MKCASHPDSRPIEHFWGSVCGHVGCEVQERRYAPHDASSRLHPAFGDPVRSRAHLDLVSWVHRIEA